MNSIDTGNLPIIKRCDGYVGIEYAGLVACADIESAYQALSDEGAFTSSCRLWDLRGCRLNLTLRDLDKLAHLSKQMDAVDSRVAILADSGVATTLAGIFGGFRTTDRVQVRTFEQHAEAVSWLCPDS